MCCLAPCTSSILYIQQAGSFQAEVPRDVFGLKPVIHVDEIAD